MQLTEVKTPLRQLAPRKIAVFRALQLGDMLCAMPAIRALKQAVPDAALTLIGLPWAAGLASRFAGYLSGFLEFPGYPGLPERDFDAGRFRLFLQKMADESFDLVVQLHGSGVISNPLVQLFAARRTAGFYRAGEYCPDPVTFIRYPDDLPEIKRHLALMEHLGCTALDPTLEFPVTDAEKAAFRALAANYGLAPGRYVCVHPGASVPERRWPVARFAEIADWLAARGHTVVLTGTAGEAALTAELARRMRHPAIDLAGKTDLGVCALLLQQARLLFSNDTGVSHIAAAMRTPSVVLSFIHEPERWAPLDRRRHRVLAHGAPGDMDLVRREIADLLGVSKIHH